MIPRQRYGELTYVSRNMLTNKQSFTSYTNLITPHVIFNRNFLADVRPWISYALPKLLALCIEHHSGTCLHGAKSNGAHMSVLVCTLLYICDWNSHLAIVSWGWSLLDDAWQFLKCFSQGEFTSVFREPIGNLVVTQWKVWWKPCHVDM